MQLPPMAGEPGRPPSSARLQEDLRTAALRLEAAFLAEMLKSAGAGRTPEGFGGGAGETQFASFLREAQARAMAEAGGIGLAEQLFRSLAARTGHD